jgi:hypothetical protein
MAKRPNLVIFCGAGFSVCAGLPVMKDFAARLRDSDLLDDDERRDFDSIQHECDYLGAIIGSSSRNLEQLASFLAVLQLTRPEFKLRCGKTAEQALDFIVEKMALLVNPTMKVTEAAVARHIFSAMNAAEVSFVTTNYDVLLELAANGENKTLQTSCCDRLTPTKSIVDARVNTAEGYRRLHENAGKRANLFKLHGSVNWFEDLAGNIAVHDTIKKGDPGGFIDYYNRQSYRRRLVVPPTVIKSQLPAPLKDQWVGAAKAISEADALWFIGYSFPATDSFMKYFLASALMDNIRLNQLLIIDPSSETLLRAKDMLSLERLKECFECIQKPWTFAPAVFDIETMRKWLTGMNGSMPY